MPTASGCERGLSPGTDLVLEVVWLAEYEQFPALLLALYPGSKATDPRQYASLNAMVWFYGSPPNFSLTKSPVLKPAPGRIS